MFDKITREQSLMRHMCYTLDWSPESAMFEHLNEPQVLSMCRARCQDDAINISYILNHF